MTRDDLEQLAVVAILGGGVYFLWRRLFPGTPDSTQELPPGESGEESIYIRTSYAPISTEDFYYSLPLAAQPYADVIAQVSSETGVDPYLIAAIGMRESGWGNLLRPRGPGGTGDSGHGHGLFQIDDRTWAGWLAMMAWQEPLTNVRKGVSIYLANRSYFLKKGVMDPTLTQAALAGFNRGATAVWTDLQASGNPDRRTAGGDYGETVLALATSYATGGTV